MIGRRAGVLDKLFRTLRLGRQLRAVRKMLAYRQGGRLSELSATLSLLIACGG
jgi:hypothetical protein